MSELQPKKRKALVIGAGIVGVCVARELQALGHEVVIVDKGSTGAGCSFANAGWVTPCFAMPLPQPGMFWSSIGWLLDNTSPLHIKPDLDPMLVRWLWQFMRAMNHKKMRRSIQVLTEISKYSFDFYTQLAIRHPMELGHEKNGLLMVSSSDKGLKYAENEMRLMAEQGIRGEFLEREKLLKFEPALRPLVKGGVFFPDEAQIEPLTATLKLAKEFTDMGGQIHPHTEVYDFVLSKQKTIDDVLTTKGRFKADLVVMAAGSWSSGLAKKLGANIPLLGGKGYSMLLERVDRKPLRPVMIVDKKIAITPRADGVRLAGTLELVNQDFSISPPRLGAIYKGAQEYLDMEHSGEPTNIWRGLRPCTPDGVPVIGFSRKLTNLFYCTGHQMLGLQSAPGSAKLAAELIEGRPTFTDATQFSPARYE